MAKQRATRENEAVRRRQLRAEAKPCAVHAFVNHGKEAEELRAGIERVLKDGVPSRVARDLRLLLDAVDARDSLAYLERPCDVKQATKLRAALLALRNEASVHLCHGREIKCSEERPGTCDLRRMIASLDGDEDLLGPDARARDELIY